MSKAVAKLQKKVSQLERKLSRLESTGTSKPRDCASINKNDVDLRRASLYTVTTVYIGPRRRPVQARCDLSPGGGWTVCIDYCMPQLLASVTLLKYNYQQFNYMYWISNLIAVLGLDTRALCLYRRSMLMVLF